MNAALTIKGLSKGFSRRQVVKDVELVAHSGEVIGIIGANGSGKSTVVKMIAGLVRPDNGSVSLSIDSVSIDASLVRAHCGLVAPYLELYDEFTPIELLRLHAQLHGTHIDEVRIHELLNLVQLSSASTRIVRGFSSGMRQRVAIALAVSLNPTLLLLDEPGVTLDEAGRSALAQCIINARTQGSIVILATNDDREREQCDRVVRMMSDE